MDESYVVKCIPAHKDKRSGKPRIKIIHKVNEKNEHYLEGHHLTFEQVSQFIENTKGKTKKMEKEWTVDTEIDNLDISSILSEVVSKGGDCCSITLPGINSQVDYLFYLVDGNAFTVGKLHHLIDNRGTENSFYVSKSDNCIKVRHTNNLTAREWIVIEGKYKQQVIAIINQCREYTSKTHTVKVEII